MEISNISFGAKFIENQDFTRNMENEAIAATPTADQTPWYAVRLFFTRYKAVSEWLKTQEMEFFVPMHYVDVEKNGRAKHILKPVVSNLVFIKKITVIYTKQEVSKWQKLI